MRLETFAALFADHRGSGDTKSVVYKNSRQTTETLPFTRAKDMQGPFVARRVAGSKDFIGPSKQFGYRVFPHGHHRFLFAVTFLPFDPVVLRPIRLTRRPVCQRLRLNARQNDMP